MADIKLSYFDVPGGRGEDCRIAMFMGGVDFEDDRIPFAEWPKRKPETPLGALPVLTVKGKGTITQSNAILTYFGRLHGLHPTDAWEAARHEALLGASEDLRVAMVPTFYMQDEGEKKRAREELARTRVRAWAALNEGEIVGPFVSGDVLHVVDLRLYVMVQWFIGGGMDHMPTDVFNDFPKLLALSKAVRAHEKVAAWYAR
jgi:glutathione S-transferase